VFVLLLTAVLFVVAHILGNRIEARFPAIGEFVDVNGVRLHYVQVSGPDDLPTVVFVHGAGANLRDQMAAFRTELEGQVPLLFIDRPGHGYSQSFEGSNDPVEQANALSGLLKVLDLGQVIVVGHSFGGAITAAFGVEHKDQAAGGLVFLAPVSHPWPGGDVSWHYSVGNIPGLGWLFSRTLAPVAGSLVYENAAARVFEPQAMPEWYPEMSGTRLVLRPGNFHENAKDVSRVYDHVVAYHPRYREIEAPTLIFHGTKDTITGLEYHSKGLEADVAGSLFVPLPGLGHKPDYVETKRIGNAIMEMARTGKVPSNP